MALRDVGNTTVYAKYNDESKGAVWAGRYTGTREGKFGKQFQLEDGETTYVLPSAGKLNKNFGSRVQVGDWVVITYKGKNAMGDGKEAHDFRIQIDDEKREALPF